jgi:hypothetical protein
MKLVLSVRDAACLKVGLEIPGMKQAYDQLVDIYMGVAGVDKAEAQATIFPDFVRALIRRVNEMADEEARQRGQAG